MTSFPLLWFLICAAACLIGSIPFGYLAGKLFHRSDIRTGGSGNIGATNALRQYGLSTAIAVLALDILKGFVVAWLANWLAQRLISTNPALQKIDPFILTLPALAVILGHMYSVFLRFRGGKGVATAAGAFLYLAPVPLLLTLAFFVVVAAITRYVSLSSILSVIFLILIKFLWDWKVLQMPVFPWFTLIVAALIIYKHHANILRLLEGKEAKLSFKKRS